MVTILRAMAHPLRLQIVAALCEEATSVNGLAAKLGVRQPIVSQQLRILRMTRLVAVSRQRGFAMYRIARAPLLEFVHAVEICCEGDRLADRL